MKFFVKVSKMEKKLKKTVSVLLSVIMILCIVPMVGAADDSKKQGINGFNFIALDGAPHKHDYNGKVTAEPSCTESGTKILTCFCGESYTETVSALGHTDSDGNGYCDRCDAKIKSTDPSSGCSHICHKKGISSFFYKIARIFWKMFKTNQYCSCGAKHY